MYTTVIALVLALWIFNFALLVDAGIYVVKPEAHSMCHGGQSCDIEWLDDGSKPLLSAIGVCTLGLYTGKQQLVQAIPAVDVSNVHGVTFTPNPAAGPDSDVYYIGIISTVLEGNTSTPYAAFSPFFSINQMTGSFETPLPAATSTIPIPSSLSLSLKSHTSTILSTITVGTLSTSIPPISTSTTTKTASTSSSSPAANTSSTQSLSSTRLTKSILPSSLSTQLTSSGSTASTGTTTRTPPAAQTSSNSACGRKASFAGSIPILIPLFLVPILHSFR